MDSREDQLLMEDVSKTCVTSVIVVPSASREEKEEFYHIKSWSEVGCASFSSGHCCHFLPCSGPLINQLASDHPGHPSAAEVLDDCKGAHLWWIKITPCTWEPKSTSCCKVLTCESMRTDILLEPQVDIRRTAAFLPHLSDLEVATLVTRPQHYSHFLEFSWISSPPLGFPGPFR